MAQSKEAGAASSSFMDTEPPVVLVGRVTATGAGGEVREEKAGDRSVHGCYCWRGGEGKTPLTCYFCQIC
jgi:hypothetical protein